MKIKFAKISVVILTLITGFSLFYLWQKGLAGVRKNNNSTADITFDQGVTLIGTKTHIEGARTAMKELVDPAVNYVIAGRNYYDNGDLKRAEEECLKALKTAKHSDVFRLAHRTLLHVYEATNRYDLALQEIDWLLDNVNEHAKPELLQCKERLQKLLQEQQK